MKPKPPSITKADILQMCRTGVVLQVPASQVEDWSSLLLDETADDGYVHEAAASRGHVSVVQWLFERSILAARKTRSGLVVLQLAHRWAVQKAIQSGHCHVVQYLISDWPKTSGFGSCRWPKPSTALRTPEALAIDSAARNGHLASLRQLLEVAPSFGWLSCDNRNLKSIVSTRHVEKPIADYLAAVMTLQTFGLALSLLSDPELDPAALMKLVDWTSRQPQMAQCLDHSRLTLSLRDIYQLTGIALTAAVADIAVEVSNVDTGRRLPDTKTIGRL